MVVRVWHGWTTLELADTYEALLFDQVIPGIRAKNIPGWLSIQVLRRRQAEVADEVEFVTLMTFDSWEAVCAFAGDDPERAYVPEAARRVLKRFDERSQHYEVRDPAISA